MKTNLLRVCALALPFLWLGVGIAHAQCKAGDILVGEDADNYYCMEKAKYEQFCRAKQAVAADQRAIAALGFALDTERFEMFENVGQEQKAELTHKLWGALFDQALAGAELTLKRAKSLNPWNVNKAVDTLNAWHFGHPAIIAALRRIALQRDKPAMFAAYRDFVEVAKSAKEGWDTGSDMAKDPDNADLRLLAGALKIVQGNPELGLAITAADLSENLRYLVYMTGEVNELANVSDDKLARLNALSKRLKGHVEDVLTLKRDWQNSTGYTTVTPHCGR